MNMTTKHVEHGYKNTEHGYKNTEDGYKTRNGSLLRLPKPNTE